MDVIRKMGENKKRVKEKFREAQEDRKIEKMLTEREKSSDQRELEKYYKDQREKQIKHELDKIHKKQTRENWKGNNLLKGGTNILKNDKPILKEKNIFLDNKTNIPFMKEEAMFFTK